MKTSEEIWRGKVAERVGEPVDGLSLQEILDRWPEEAKLELLLLEIAVLQGQFDHIAKTFGL